jgi:hypothetical protein
VYFPQALTKLTKLADSPALDSLGTVESGALLALFKRHCALPSDSSWTEADLQLGLYLDAAERFVDSLTGTPYRPHSYTLDLQTLSQSNLLALPLDNSAVGIVNQANTERLQLLDARNQLFNPTICQIIMDVLHSLTICT